MKNAGRKVILFLSLAFLMLLATVASVFSLSVIGTIPAETYPANVCYDSGVGEIFVANYASESVSVISDSANKVVATLSVGKAPEALIYDPDKGEIFVANADSNTVSVISGASGNIISPSPTVSEFSAEGLILLALIMVAVTLCACAKRFERKKKTGRNIIEA